MGNLYHRVPADMRGEILYPLNQLKEKYPGLYVEAIKKYKGREILLERKVPALDCLWNDVLHFSAVDPDDIRKELIANNSPLMRGKFYKIKPEMLDRKNTVVYLYKLPTPGNQIPLQDFIPYDPANVEAYSNLPEETKAYYAETIAGGGKPLLWHLVPHILYKGSLDISRAEILEF